MYKKILFIFIILLCMNGCINKNSNNIDDSDNDNVVEVDNLNITINSISYSLDVENNKTVSELKKILPLELDMDELNGNEKYVYLDKSLPTDSYYPKHIKAGDVMLYGNNCLVIFYKSFDTSYSYTKIGHIDNIGDLGNSSIKVLIEHN